MPSLREKQPKAQALSERFAEEFKAIRQGARDGKAASQLQGTPGPRMRAGRSLALPRS